MWRYTRGNGWGKYCQMSLLRGEANAAQAERRKVTHKRERHTAPANVPLPGGHRRHTSRTEARIENRAPHEKAPRRPLYHTGRRHCRALRGTDRTCNTCRTVQRRNPVPHLRGAVRPPRVHPGGNPRTVHRLCLFNNHCIHGIDLFIIISVR